MVLADLSGNFFKQRQIGFDHQLIFRVAVNGTLPAVDRLNRIEGNTGGQLSGDQVFCDGLSSTSDPVVTRISPSGEDGSIRFHRLVHGWSMWARARHRGDKGRHGA